jgi:hypothetical protein
MMPVLQYSIMVSSFVQERVIVNVYNTSPTAALDQHFSQWPT